MRQPVQVYSILKRHFKFDKIFNLFEYSADMSKLYHDLLELKQDSYEHDYRFVFLHYDTDYYITNNQPGLLLRNLQKILFTLDISNYFCLILTQQNIDKELEILRHEETTDVYAIASIQHWLQDLLWTIAPETTELNVDSISAKYQSLCRQRRSHRTLLYSLLCDKNLVDHGMVSFCNND
jgi:hypothetical protein